MRWVVLIAAGLVAGGLDGCFFLRCDDTLHGISEGEPFQTTIIGSFDGSTLPPSESCGDLGDLVEGTTLLWKAHPRGPGDGCDDYLELQVSSVSTGEVKGTRLTLPNGCTGTWRLTAEALKDDTDLVSTPDAAHPTWYLKRTFQPSGGKCFADEMPRASCSDAFVASSKRQADL